MSKICLITGASRGIGAAVYAAVEEAGHHPIALVRDPSDVEGEGYRVDVKDRASIEEAVGQVMEVHGRIDVLINNAGYGLLGPIEMVSDQEMEEQFDVNVFGPIRMIQAVLPHMREACSGLIINISSLAGMRPNSGSGLYGASKFAIQSITTSLASQLAEWNIRTISVNPGWVNTGFINDTRVGTRMSGEPYQSFIDGYIDHATRHLAEGQDPVEVGEIVAQLIDNPDPDLFNATTEEGRNLLAGILVDPSGRQQVEANLAEAVQWYQH